MQVNDAALRLLRADACGGRAMLSLKAIGIVLCVLLPGAYAHGDEGHGTNGAQTEEVAPTEETETEMVQKTCPVMVGNKIDPEIYTVYKDKKVYFCCLICKATFEQNPEQYVTGLPQFASIETEIEHTHTATAAKTEIERVPTALAALRHALARLVKPLGITTATLLMLTACAGFFMPKKRKVLFKLHRWLAVATLIAALCHVTLVLLFH